MSWTIRVSDSQFVPQGELVDVKELHVGIPLNKARTSSFKVRLDNPLSPFLATRVSNEPLYVKMYRNGVLMFHGPVASVQEAGDEAQDATLAVTAVGPEYIWAFRYYTGSATPVKFPAGTARSQKFKEMLAAYKESENLKNRTYIDFTTGPITGGATDEYEVQAFKTLQEILSDLINGAAAGFDWTVWPTDTKTVGGVPTIGRLETAESIGLLKNNAVFEWGGSRNNVATFNRTVDVSQLANFIYSVSPSGPESSGAPTQEAGNVPLAELWQVRQAQAQLSALSNELRKKLAEETLSVRELPRQTFTFTPIVDSGNGLIPSFGADYTLGDTVRARILYEEVLHLDVFARVWAVGFAVDESGKETQTLTLSEE